MRSYRPEITFYRWFSHGWQAKIAIAGIAYNNSRQLYLHLIRQFEAVERIGGIEKIKFQTNITWD